MADYQITFIVILKLDLKKDLWIVVRLEKNWVNSKPNENEFYQTIHAL
jgi:hypothetical protein